MTSLSRFFPAFLLVAFLLSGLTACDSTVEEEDTFPDPELTVVEDLPADPFIGFGDDGRPIGNDTFTFYSLRENAVVPAEDSASTQWDIALKGTTILINGGASGPGDGAAQVVEGIFEEILEAPATGWAVDSEAGPAIPTGSGSGWYNYNPATHIISPIPGRVLMIRTADGRYAKMRILSYYEGAPDTPDENSSGRYYTFEYVFQPDGSMDLSS